MNAAAFSTKLRIFSTKLPGTYLVENIAPPV